MSELHTIATILSSIILLALGVTPLVFFSFFKKAFFTLKEQEKSQSVPFPTLAVIVPCKGGDFEFEDNLNSFFNFDYPSYHLIFVTATDDDTARPSILKVIERNHHHRQVSLLTAGITNTCAQKLNNLIYAAKQVPKATEILIFLDSDTRVHSDLLVSLVKSLNVNEVGAATGFPVFSPNECLASRLRFTSGIGGLITMHDEKFNFTHGAVNAIRKSDFWDWGLGSTYSRSLSDSFEMTQGVKKQGKKIGFSPGAIVLSPDSSSMHEVLAWSNRLTVLSRVYHPKLWGLLAINYGTMGIALLFLILATVSSFPHTYLTMGTLSMFVLLQATLTIRILQFIPSLLYNYPQAWGNYRSQRWKFLVAGQLAIPVIVWNLLVSLFLRKLSWRNIQYKIISKHNIEMIKN